MNWKQWCGIALAMTTAFSFARAAEPLTLDEALGLAEARSPQLRSAEAQERSAREMAVAAGQLPDPVLKLGVNNVPVSGDAAWSLVQESMTMRSIGLMQELTRSDKRAARAARAEREADLASVQQRQALVDTRRETAQAWFALAYQLRMRALLDAQLAELELQVQAADAAFRGGRGEQADVFATRVAAERMRDQRVQMTRDIVAVRAQLARWIGSEAERAPAPPPDVSQLAWSPAGLAEALDEHPAIAALNGQLALAEADARLARENRKPDVAVELMLSQRGPAYANMVSLNFSMPLPWDRADRQDRELAARLAQVEQVRAQQEDMRRSYTAQLRATLAAWQADRARVQRYDDVLVPLAQQQVDAALAAYRAGNGALARVLDARRMALDTRMERQRVALDAARDWSQLNFLDPAAHSAGAALPAPEGAH